MGKRGNKPDPDSKRQKVKDFILDGGKLSPIEAEEKFGLARTSMGSTVSAINDTINRKITKVNGQYQLPAVTQIESLKHAVWRMGNG